MNNTLGKTLRDEFAMNAIIGILSNTKAFNDGAILSMKNHTGFSSLVFLAYYIADEMIIERNTKRNSKGFLVAKEKRKTVL